MYRIVLASILTGAATLATAAGKPPCRAPAYHQFDFWVGDWDTFDADGHGTSQARNHVDSILGGCVIRERYEQNDGLVGESFSIYDASRHVWHQTWVTNRGTLLMIEGVFKNGVLTLQGGQTGKTGKPELIRGTWNRQGDGVRETVHTSSDGGKTWKPYFDILFKPHRG